MQLSALRDLISQAHELERVLACNIALPENERDRANTALRKLIAGLYAQLNEIPLPEQPAPVGYRRTAESM
mgnify:CR=1 FL=1